MNKQKKWTTVNAIVALSFVAAVALACAVWFFVYQRNDPQLFDRGVVSGPKPVMAVKVLRDNRNREYLADENGMTLYIYAKDEIGVSNCNEECLSKWPPLKTQGTRMMSEDQLPRPLSFIIWHDDSRQVTYDGRPLYYYLKDVEPGDMLGKGINDDWSVARP